VTSLFNLFSKQFNRLERVLIALLSFALAFFITLAVDEHFHTKVDTGANPLIIIFLFTILYLLMTRGYAKLAGRRA
jgi:hypothetical protein